MKYTEQKTIHNKLIFTEEEKELIENMRNLLCETADTAQEAEHVDDHLIDLIDDLIDGIREFAYYDNNISIK